VQIECAKLKKDIRDERSLMFYNIECVRVRVVFAGCCIRNTGFVYLFRLLVCFTIVFSN
jgi:hypothetical protein